MADIGEELLRAVRADFRRELGDSDSRLAKLLKRIQGGKGTMHDAALFSKECGAALSAAIAKNVVPENLPNGTLYYNIAEKILGGTLRDNYDLLNMVAQAVQEQTDSKLNIRIEPQKAEFPQERVHKIINAAADQTADSETIKRRLDSPVRNVTESFFDDYVEENAKFRDEAGLQTYLVRQTNGKCCDWCASLAGRFRYEDAPEDIFHKHDNCTCTVDYITGTYRQDVWSKRKYALTPEERKRILESVPMPTRFTKEQAQNLQNNILNGVANAGSRIDYMSNSFRPVFAESNPISFIRGDEIETIEVKRVSNSNFNIVTDVENTRRNKAVRLIERHLTAIQGDLPKEFELPQIAVVDFDRHNINSNAIGGYDRNTGILYINSKYDTPEKVLGFVNQTQGMFANNTQYAPILHELGHKYYYDSINKLAISQGIEYNKAKGIIDHRLYDYICENVLDKSISKQISTYAQLHYDKSNYTELIAESFSISGTSDVARALIELLKG